MAGSSSLRGAEEGGEGELDRLPARTRPGLGHVAGRVTVNDGPRDRVQDQVSH